LWRSELDAELAKAATLVARVRGVTGHQGGAPTPAADRVPESLRRDPETVQAPLVRARAMAMAGAKIPALLNDSITGSSTRPSRWIASRRGWLAALKRGGEATGSRVIGSGVVANGEQWSGAVHHQSDLSGCHQTRQRYRVCAAAVTPRPLWSTMTSSAPSTGRSAQPDRADRCPPADQAGQREDGDRNGSAQDIRRCRKSRV
jgi:hypothetical protein